MIIDVKNLTDLATGYKTSFNKAMAESPSIKKLEAFSFLFMKEKSTGASEKFGFVVDTAAWREWVGEREYKNLKVEVIEVVNKHFEKSYSLKATDIEDDKQNMLLPAVKVAGSDWPKVMMSLVFDVINSNPKIYDGLNLFAAHKYGEEVINNAGVKKLTATSYEAAVVLMSDWKAANGSNLGVAPTHLMVAPNLRAIGFGIVSSEKLDGNKNNPNYQHSELVVCPDLPADHWCLVDSSGAMKPVMLQERKTPNPSMDTDPVMVIREGKMVFMADGRGAAGGTVPHLIYRSTGTTA